MIYGLGVIGPLVSALADTSRHAWKSTATTMGFAMACGFLFYCFFQSSGGNLSVLPMGVMQGFGVVPQRLLCGAFRIIALERASAHAHRHD